MFCERLMVYVCLHDIVSQHRGQQTETGYELFLQHVEIMQDNATGTGGCHGIERWQYD